MLATISINIKGNAIDIAPDCIADRAYEPPPIKVQKQAILAQKPKDPL